MTKELNPSHNLEDNIYRAINASETITDKEREAWLNDPEFMDSFQTMMEAKRAMLSETTTDTQQALNAFVAEHQEQANRFGLHINWWKMTIVAAAACMAGWWLLPKLFERELQTDSAKTIYHASAPKAAITITEGNDIVMEKKHDEQSISNVKNIIANGDTIIYQPIDLSKYPLVESTIKVAQGQTALLVLSDGTKVWLNSHSSLIYPNAFAANAPRQVQLKGEAYFDVTPDKKRPFIVDCGQLQTTVLGTSFNVRNYQESEPSVTLEHGSVKVSEGSRQIVLKPCQTVTLTNDNQLEVATADMESVLCWRDGMFFFDGKTLREVLLEMGRWYNMDVVVQNDSHLNDRLHFRGERCWDLKELIESLNIICDIQLDIEDKAIVLR